MSEKEPFDKECSNPGWGVGWTSPCCYTDLGDVGEGLHTCPTCGRTIRCTSESQPVQVATLVVNELVDK